MINLSSLFRITPSNYRNPSTLISALIIIATIANFILSFKGISTDSFGITEFMINFKGGFVRRGAIGEILYNFISATGLPVIPLIVIFCTLCYFLVLVFFIFKFQQRGYCWWLIFCPFFLGMNLFLIRKDFLLYLNFIGIILLLSDKDYNPLKTISASILAVWTIFIHEAFIFFGGAFTLFLLLRADKYRVLNWTLALIIVAAFLLNSYFKGSVENVIAIRSSWNDLLNIHMADITENSIGAIGWATLHTMNFHIHANYFNTPGFQGLFFQPLNALCSYYVMTSFLSIFKGNHASFDSQERTLLSSLYVMCLICLIPMFTVLSCDFARLYQYANVTALTCFLLLPVAKIKAITPSVITSFCTRVNTFIDQWIKPNKVTLIAALMLFAQAPFNYDPFANFRYSIWGSFANALFYLDFYLRLFIHHV